MIRCNYNQAINAIGPQADTLQKIDEQNLTQTVSVYYDEERTRNFCRTITKFTQLGWAAAAAFLFGSLALVAQGSFVLALMLFVLCSGLVVLSLHGEFYLKVMRESWALPATSEPILQIDRYGIALNLPGCQFERLKWQFINEVEASHLGFFKVLKIRPGNLDDLEPLAKTQNSINLIRIFQLQGLRSIFIPAYFLPLSTKELSALINQRKSIATGAITEVPLPKPSLIEIH